MGKPGKLHIFPARENHHQHGAPNSLWGKNVTKNEPRTTFQGNTFTGPDWPPRENVTHTWSWTTFREDPFRLVPPLCGHCPNSNYTPPALKRALWGTFFRRDFTILPFLRLFLPFFYHFLWISAPNHPGKGLDPPKIKQMPIWTWKILL